jgi:hypothetical protein
MIFLFMTHDALNSFRNSKGWSVGGEGSRATLSAWRRRCPPTT